jgi:hypothetical protein
MKDALSARDKLVHLMRGWMKDALSDSDGLTFRAALALVSLAGQANASSRPVA